MDKRESVLKPVTLICGFAISRVSNHGFSKASGYYSFDMASFRFVVPDADYTGQGVAYDHGNFDWEDAYIREDQLSWLKKDLPHHKKAVIVFVHQQLDSPAFNEKHQMFCVNNAHAAREISEV